MSRRPRRAIAAGRGLARRRASPEASGRRAARSSIPDELPRWRGCRARAIMIVIMRGDDRSSPPRRHRSGDRTRSRPGSGCRGGRSRCSSRRATTAPGSRTSPAPPGSRPVRSTPTTAARPSCSSTRSARSPASRSTRCSQQARGREAREVLEQLGATLTRRDAAPARAAARRGRRGPPRPRARGAAARPRVGTREAHARASSSSARSTTARSIPDIEPATLAYYCTTLAMGALVMRTLELAPPGPGRLASVDPPLGRRARPATGEPS